MRYNSLLCVFLVFIPLDGSAQQLQGLGGPVAESDLLYFAGEPLLAYESLAVHLNAHPADFDALWRMARACVVVGFAGGSSQGPNHYYDLALHYARRAVEVRPEDIEGIYWRGVAAGRRALNAGIGHSVELALITYADAHTVLEADSLHAGAHNMLGKLNYEVMILSWIERWLVRTFMGNEAIKDTSWEKAERHLARAAELSPDFVLYQFDLGTLYEKRGRDEEAAGPLARARDLPVVHPIDPELQKRAVALLDRIQR